MTSATPRRIRVADDLDRIYWAAETFDNPKLDGYHWLFFRAPDGNVYALQQERAAAP
ncbi:MAG: hypothetical protein AABZ33_03280 [Chloroflexota bacterium]